MKHLSAIAHRLSVDVSFLRDLERVGHFAPVDSDSEGHLYDPREVKAAITRTRAAAPLHHFSRLVDAVEFISKAKTPQAREIRCEAANYVLDRVNAETKADVAKRLNISRTHFSLICSRFSELTLLR